MENINKEIEYIKEQIVSKYKPKYIILFGSVAKGIYRDDSDIDLFIVKDTDNKRKLLTDIYVDVDSNIPYDLVLYTAKEWNEYVDDKSTFAYVINNTGVKIYG